MAERIIQSIEEFENLKLLPSSRPWAEFAGYKVICADGHTYSLGIESGQDCCERFGYLSSEDDLVDFVGAKILDAARTDTSLCTKKLKDDELYVEDCMFITFKTDRGDFQLVVYNQHNGYYGHPVAFVSGDEILEEVL
jgi:hypothetical protein